MFEVIVMSNASNRRLNFVVVRAFRYKRRECESHRAGFYEEGSISHPPQVSSINVEVHLA